MTSLAQERPRVVAYRAGEGLLQAVLPVLLGAFVIGLPIALHLVGHAAAIAVCIVLGVIVGVYVSAAVPVVMIVAYIFQNLFVAFVSPALSSADELNSIRGYNFLLTAAIWLVLAINYWTERGKFSPEMRRLIDLTTLALTIIGGYFCLGVASDPVSAAVYLRNIATPFLLLQIFAWVAYRQRIELTGPLTLIAVLMAIYGYVELLWPAKLYGAVHGDHYLTIAMQQNFDSGYWVRQMQETGFVIRSYLDTLVMDFLNTPLLGDLGLQFNRILGPNFHPISYGYSLAILAIMLTATGRWWIALIVLPLVVVVGAKGALVLVTVSMLALLLVTLVPEARRLWLFIGLLVCYAAFGIATGIRNEDYHIIGFFGGLRGFISDPIGHGLGAGGNLSTNFTRVDWDKAQNLGHTDVAVESAIGVLLFQVGAAGLVLIGILAYVARRLWQVYRVTLDPVLAAAAIALFTILFNGIFQEEALFAPLALGLIAAFAGFLLGSVYREIEPAQGARMPAGQRPVAEPQPVRGG